MKCKLCLMNERAIEGTAEYCIDCLKEAGKMGALEELKRLLIVITNKYGECIFSTDIKNRIKELKKMGV